MKKRDGSMAPRTIPMTIAEVLVSADLYLETELQSRRELSATEYQRFRAS